MKIIQNKLFKNTNLVKMALRLQYIAKLSSQEKTHAGKKAQYIKTTDSTQKAI